MTTEAKTRLDAGNAHLANIIVNYGEKTHEFNINPGVTPHWYGLTVTIRQRGDRFALLMDDDDRMSVFHDEAKAIKAAGYVVKYGNLDQFYADDRAAKGWVTL